MVKVRLMLNFEILTSNFLFVAKKIAPNLNNLKKPISENFKKL